MKWFALLLLCLGCCHTEKFELRSKCELVVDDCQELGGKGPCIYRCELQDAVCFYSYTHAISCVGTQK